MTQFLFSCKRSGKNTLKSAPSPTFTWGNEALRDRSADGVRDEDYLNSTRGKASGEQLLQESVEAPATGLVCMHVQGQHLKADISCVMLLFHVRLVNNNKKKF